MLTSTGNTAFRPNMNSKRRVSAVARSRARLKETARVGIELRLGLVLGQELRELPFFPHTQIFMAQCKHANNAH